MSRGLTSQEAARRLAANGPNRIEREQPTSRVRVLARQFASPLVAILVVAGAISAAVGELADAIAIAAIVAINAIVGFVQEDRATRAVLALRAMTAPRARVLRDATPVVIAAADVVVGDALLLEAGDVIAADARVVEAAALSCNEAALTGESTPSRKTTVPSDLAAPLADRHDRVFLGTAVATGTGVAEVTATGMSTELGNIAHMLGGARHDPTPLQARLARVAHVLLVACVAIVATVATAELLRGRPAFDVFLSAVSLAIAAVPEGLPAIVTIALAVGVQRMAARHALIRRLAAVETLGSASVICTDKTGTLTTGTMTVREIDAPDDQALLDAAAACCDADLDAAVGDPTELAILAAAAQRDIRRPSIEAARPRVEVEPFDPVARRMAIRRADGVRYVKGAIEVIAPACTRGAIDRGRAAASRMAAQGLRTLAIAAGPADDDLELLGVVGIADPPRPSAIQAVADAHRAGITTVMITGDHPQTALAIARELGIDEAHVHARTSPEQKLEIVRAWKRRGAIVAMTGDGVNDAPALREAHVGIAMGRTGTEVTREAADIVLTDDDYAAVVAAVHEGRGIFENLRRTLIYLLTGNAAELAVMLAAAIAGMPLPLLPLSLLWINLVTDGLPALALVTEPQSDEVMSRPPRRADEPMLGRAEWLQIAVVAAIEATIVLSVFASSDSRSLTLATLVFCELFRAFGARSATRLFWEVGAFTNLRLVAIVSISALAQIALHQIELTRALFRLDALDVSDLALAVGLGLIPVTCVEIAKLGRRGARLSRSGAPRAGTSLAS